MVSIIVVCRNQLAFTRLCLESVFRHADVPHELIAVDNGSTDGTRAYLKSLNGVRTVFNGRNRGFAGGMNRGMRLARGRYYWLLNNDVVITPGCLRALVNVLDADKQIGAAAPWCNPPQGKVFDPPNGRTGGRVSLRPKMRFEPFYQGDKDMLRYAWLWTRLNRRRREDHSPASFSCYAHLVRRELVDDIGLIDERYGRGYFEDVDFFFRAVWNGWRLVRLGAAYVHHFWGVTYRGHRRNPKRLARRGLEKFVEKWGAAAWRDARQVTQVR